MRQVRLFVVASAAAASVLGAGLLAQSFGPNPFEVTPQGITAQVPDAPTMRRLDPAGGLISGDNIGFLPSAGPSSAGTIPGRLMVRVDGQWLVASSPMTLGPAGH